MTSGSTKKRNHRAAPSAKSILLLIGILLLLAAGIFLLHSRQNQFSAQAGSLRNYNVLLITIDTLRADHLPVYGAAKVQTPTIDRLASSSVIFDQAMSHVPLTLPAHTSILTGLLPPAHGVTDNAGFLVAAETTTLAEMLQKQGYETSAFVSAFVLDSSWNLDQGFDTYFDEFISMNSEERTASETAEEAAGWLSQPREKPFFCWIHFYDPHDPYTPPEPYRSRYPDAPYDGEIGYTDAMLDKVMNALAVSGQSERTIVILTGDHGESFGEHGEKGHALFLYNPTQHVPLLIHVPDQRSVRIAEAVGHIDIVPTLLEMLGLGVPHNLQGKSLLPLMNGERRKSAPIYLESLYSELHFGWSPLRGIVTAEYKYIRAPKAELYDRINDPAETRNLIGEKPYVAKAMEQQLSEFLVSIRASDAQPKQPDAEVAEKLRSLGYIGTITESTPESRNIDPKDRIAFYQAYQDSLTAIKMKQYTRALQLLDPLLQQTPSLIDAQFSAGIAYAGLSNFEKAIDHYLKTLALKPDYQMAYFNLASAYELQGNLMEAAGWYTKLLEDGRKHRFAATRLAAVYRKLQERQKADEYLQKAIVWHEEVLSQTKGAAARSDLHSRLAEICFDAGKFEDAEKHLRSAIELTPSKPLLHYNLAQVQEAREHYAEATREYEKEIAISPHYYDAYLNLGLLYRKSHRFRDASLCFRKLLDLRPGDRQAAYLLAETMHASKNS